MFPEDELLPISALQHLAFCERQWALIHLEGLWEENRLTVEGHHLHDRVDAAETEVRGDVRIARGLPLRSLQLGLIGRADVVEFHRLDENSTSLNNDAMSGARLPEVPGLWRPYPVEYKHGRPKPDPGDAIQLCAQTLCLEEMMNVTIPVGALFYGRTHRRHDVEFDDSLRQQTRDLVTRLYVVYQTGQTPLARYEKKCDACSLYNLCLPKVIGPSHSAQEYVASIFEVSQDR